jgi:23S rRNA (adenine2503-C2)-methyltransferase
MNDPTGFGLGARQIAISTAGWVPGIDRLAAEPMQIKLALSLHAPDDELRGQLMPVTRRYPIAALMDACRRYRAATRRRIFVEYLLLEGVNDSRAHARALADLLRPHGRGAFHVNLIAYNPTAAGFTASPPARVDAFAAELRRRGVATSYRRSHGSDIAAACGQLAVAGAAQRRRELRRAAVR